MGSEYPKGRQLTQPLPPIFPLSTPISIRSDAKRSSEHEITQNRRYSRVSLSSLLGVRQSTPGSTYRDTHTFIEDYHRQLTKSLEHEVVVDTRIGLGENGLYQEPLEVVLEYCGLRMKADQVVNESIDGADTKRLLIPQHRARNAHYWFLLSPAGASYTWATAERKKYENIGRLIAAREEEEERLANPCESCNEPANEYDTLQSCGKCYKSFCNSCRDFCECCCQNLCKDTCGGNRVVWSESSSHTFTDSNGNKCYSACGDCR
jgi:hypothetical protein